MKKLMIAAAIVCAAAFAQAATFNWGFSSDAIEDPAGNAIEGGMAYLYVAGELIASGPQNEDWTYGSFDLTATSDKLVALADGSISDSFVGQAYKLVLKYTDEEGVDWEATYNGTSSYKPVAGAAGEKAKNYETFTTGTAFTANDWQVVPEPTSGLLLLIGVAGLALRRRRA